MIPMPTPPRYYPHQFPPAVTHASTNYLSRMMGLDEDDDMLSPPHALIDFDDLPVDDALGAGASSNVFILQEQPKSPISNWVDEFTIPKRESPKRKGDSRGKIRSPPVPLDDLSPPPKTMCISNPYD